MGGQIYTDFLNALQEAHKRGWLGNSGTNGAETTYSSSGTYSGGSSINIEGLEKFIERLSGEFSSLENWLEKFDEAIKTATDKKTNSQSDDETRYYDNQIKQLQIRRDIEESRIKIEKANEENELASLERDAKIYKERSEHAEEEAELDKKRIEEENKYIKQDEENKRNRKKADTENTAYIKGQTKHQNNLYTIEAKFHKDHIDEQKEIWDREEKMHNDELAIQLTHNKAMSKARQEELKGYKDGKKKSSAEFHEKIANFKKWNEENTFGRKAGDVINSGLGMMNSGLGAINSGSVNVGGIASKASGMLSSMGPWGAAAGGVLQIFAQLFEIYSEVDKAASSYARTVGGGAYAQKKMATESVNLASSLTKELGVAVNAKEVLEAMASTSELLGRNMEGVSEASIKEMVAWKKFGIDSSVFRDYDTLGLSIHRASKELGDLYNNSGKKGLNFTATMKMVTSNLKVVQNYSFAKGRKALTEMAEKSVQLKTNIQDAVSFADKVSTLEGSLQAGAQLSVLGGTFASQGNPLAMLYNGLNDVQGLQDQLIAMTQGMASWDSKSGDFKIGAFNQQRLRAASQATGVDYNELTTQAMNQAKMNRISQQIGGGVSKETAEYMKNLAEIDEKGVARIHFHDKFGKDENKEGYTIDEIKNNKELLNRLAGESDAKSEKENATIGDVLGSTKSIQDSLDQILQVLKNFIARGVMKIANFFGAGMDELELKYGMNEKEIEEYEEAKNRRDKAKFGLGQTGHYYGMSNEQIAKEVASEEARKKRSEDPSWSSLAKEEKPAEKMSMAGRQFNIANGTPNAWNMVPMRSDGGSIIGPGGPKDDKIPAMLSNGEYVLPADYVKNTGGPSYWDGQIGKGISNVDNSMGYRHFSNGGSTVPTQQGQNNEVSGSIKIEFGTLKLDIGGISKDVDQNLLANKLLNNSTFIDMLVTQIATKHDYGNRKNDRQYKFTPYAYT